MLLSYRLAAVIAVSWLHQAPEDERVLKLEVRTFTCCYGCIIV